MPWRRRTVTARLEPQAQAQAQPDADDDYSGYGSEDPVAFGVFLGRRWRCGPLIYDRNIERVLLVMFVVYLLHIHVPISYFSE